MSNLGIGTGHVENTSPYPWPYDGNLAGEGTAVIVVRPQGEVWAADSTVDRVNAAAAEVATAVSSVGGAVISVVTAPPNSQPVLDAATGLPAGKIAMEAAGIDGFFSSPLDATLRQGGIERLILVGYGTETCVHSTMRSANDRGYECLLVSDACLAYDPSLTSNTLSMIEMSGGIFGAIGSSADVVAAFTSGSTS